MSDSTITAYQRTSAACYSAYLDKMARIEEYQSMGFPAVSYAQDYLNAARLYQGMSARYSAMARKAMGVET